MSKDIICSKCEHHRFEYRHHIENENPEPISICDLHHIIQSVSQTGCDGTDFISKEDDK